LRVHRAQYDEDPSMPVFMKYDGVKGDCTAAGFLGAFELESAQFGTQRITAVGQGTSRDGGRAPLQDIAITLRAGAAAQKLFSEAVNGKGRTVVITFVHEGQAYLTVTLENTLISGFSIGGGHTGDPLPFASLSLNFSKITYTQMNPEQSKNALKPGPGFTLKKP
jgi:type VI protein secretion system component Hcp